MHSTTGHARSHAVWMVPALAGVVAGSGLQLGQPALFPWTLYLAMLALGLLLLAWAGASPVAGAWIPALAGLACAIAAYGATGWRAAVFMERALPAALEGRDIMVTGVVAAMPQVNEAGTRFRFEVESARQAQLPVQLPPRIYLAWYTGSVGLAADAEGLDLQRQPLALRAGERWRLTVRLKAPHGNSNPHGFDYELWLWEQGLQATGYVRAGANDGPAQSLGQTWRHPVEYTRQLVRDRILDRVHDARLAGLIAALVVGDQNAIDRADWDVFRATGVAHLMSISGLHVTMFAWLAMAVIGACWRRSTGLCLRVAAPHAAWVGGLLMATAYAVFSGWGVPSQRTVWMLASTGVLRLSGKRWPWPVVWLLACAVVVVLDPWALTQAGFWLSFIAVGVLFASTEDARGSTPAQGTLTRLRTMLREQWVLTLALAPLTLLLFGQVSLVGLVANAVAIPWVTLIVTPLAMLGVLWPTLWDLAAGALAALGGYLGLLARMPLATVSVAMAPWWAGAAGLLGGVLLVLRLPWSLRLAALPLLLPVLLWQSPRPPEGEFELLAVDIGQGNAVLVRTARHALLYDAGPRFSRDSDAGHRVLVPLLRALDVRLDMLLLSHRDSDHAGGAAAVLAMQTQAELRSSVEPEHELHALRPIRRCEAGQSWRWDGVDFAILHPTSADYGRPARPNALSCVLRISSQARVEGQVARVALLAGDIERAQELRLVADGAPLKADVLLVPHHGSKTSSSPEFLDAVAPALAVAQAGYRNRFGHPAEVPMARYRERGIRVLDSAHCGAMTWRSDQAPDAHCQRADGLRYWHHVVP